MGSHKQHIEQIELSLNQHADKHKSHQLELEAVNPRYNALDGTVKGVQDDTVHFLNEWKLQVNRQKGVDVRLHELERRIVGEGAHQLQVASSLVMEQQNLSERDKGFAKKVGSPDVSPQL